MGTTHRGRSITAVNVTAYAKVNLALEVVGRRNDGLHDVVTVMQTVDLRDRLHLCRGETMSLQCNVEEITTPNNLVLRALKLLGEITGRVMSVSVRLYKGIPIGAGLGGGSSDAAAVLVAASRLAGVALDRHRLSDLAFRLGADVPFFLQGGTCLASGAGEKIRKLQPLRQRFLLLVVPPIAIPDKTKTLYSLLSPRHYTQGETTMALAEAIDRGELPPEDLMINTFQNLVLSHFRNLSAYWEQAAAIAGRPPHLSGSGPAFFFLMDNLWEARALSREMRSHSLRAVVVRPTRRGHVIRATARVT